jgi:regulation of enolase protein 1 (concanavalin A-like superfamily)
MPHRAAFLCLACVAGVIVAAPAPRPKPKATGPWFTGWDEPTDVKGDCRFDRVGGKLTITVPGKRHRLDFDRNGRGFGLAASSRAPLLSRVVEGNFAVQVRVAATLTPAPGRRVGRPYAAGLLLLNGNTSVQKCLYYPLSREKPMYWRLERRGKTVTVKSSDDGARWLEEARTSHPDTPRKVKLAVVASSDGPGSFKAIFDKLKLTGGSAAKK